MAITNEDFGERALPDVRQGTAPTLQIGSAVFDPDARTITCADKKTVLEPRLCALLLALAAVSGAITRTELLDQVWGYEGSDEALTQAVSKLRKALGDTERPYRIIETVPKGGYRLCTPVDVAAKGKQVNAAASSAGAVMIVAAHIRKRREFYSGAALGAAVILLGMAVMTILSPPAGLEQEIVCPDHWSAADCVDVIKAATGGS